jgi:hypothetical protein
MWAAWTEKQLRTIPPFEFENWAVIALGGIPNKTQVGDMGIDGRIYHVGAEPTAPGKEARQLDFMDDWYPIQVKQMDKVGRPDIDKFEAAMMRTRRKKGFLVGFDFSSDALREIDQVLPARAYCNGSADGAGDSGRDDCAEAGLRCSAALVAEGRRL